MGAVQAFDSFESTLAFLYKHAAEKELIVVIDEYPYIRKVIEGLNSMQNPLLVSRLIFFIIYCVYFLFYLK